MQGQEGLHSNYVSKQRNRGKKLINNLFKGTLMQFENFFLCSNLCKNNNLKILYF